MFGLDNPSGINVMPAITPTNNSTPLWFTEGGAGLSASYPGQEWFNQVQAELLNVLKEAGVTPDKGKLNQLSAAIKKIVSDGWLSKQANGADIPNPTEFVKNLGLVKTVERAESAVPNSRKINSKSLMGDITLSADDVHAYPRGTYQENLPDDNYHGPFSCGKTTEWARGVSVGIGGNTGQIWIDSGATLHTRFLNSNHSVAQQRIVSVPIGATLEWQSRVPIPPGFLINDGREFDKSRYAELLTIFPTGRIPDDRGLFKRGLDYSDVTGSRGYDPGRELGTIQGDAIRNITGRFGTPTTESGLTNNYGNGAFDVAVTKFGRQAGSGGDSVSYSFDASRVVPTANENRPVNKSVIYITRAF